MKLKQVSPKDFAYLQVCVEALNERVNMLEAENVRLRAMWGGVNSHGQPNWVAFKPTVCFDGSITTCKNTTTA